MTLVGKDFNARTGNEGGGIEEKGIGEKEGKTGGNQRTEGWIVRVGN